MGRWVRERTQEDRGDRIIPLHHRRADRKLQVGFSRAIPIDDSEGAFDLVDAERESRLDHPGDDGVVRIGVAADFERALQFE